MACDSGGGSSSQPANVAANEQLITQTDASSFAGLNTVSPYGQRLAYVATRGNSWFVVVDGKEENRYDVILPTQNRGIAFDPSNTFRYVAMKLAEERLSFNRVEMTLSDS